MPQLPACPPARMRSQVEQSCRPYAGQIAKYRSALRAFGPLGLSLIIRSATGAALTSAWLAIVWVITQVEEESVVREYDDADRDFQDSVPRLLPRPPSARRRRAL